MAVILSTKPRVRLPPDDLPEPRLVRSRSWLPYYLALWICAVIVGHGILYGWLPFIKTHGAAVAASAPLPVQFDTSRQTVKALVATHTDISPVVQQPAPRIERAAKPALDLDHLPSCDVSEQRDSDQPEGAALLPVDLSRSVLGKLLEFRRWTGPCRGRHAARVHLCLAVRGGNILGATAHADPRDSSLERCVIRAASLVDLEPEDTLRIVRLDVEIAPER